MTTFYTYLHSRPETETVSGIFYVGKGSGKRAVNIESRNPHHGNIVRKHGGSNILVSIIECSSEKIAFDLEKGLIKCLRRSGVHLSNKTDGGEGSSGFKFSDKSKKLMSDAKIGQIASDETKTLQSKVHKDRYTDPVERMKTSLVMSGRKRMTDGKQERNVKLSDVEDMLKAGWTFGRKSFTRASPSIETRLKISAANQGQEAWNKGLSGKRCGVTQTN